MFEADSLILGVVTLDALAAQTDRALRGTHTGIIGNPILGTLGHLHGGGCTFYRRSGGKGLDYFLIPGDPNAKARVRHLTFKVVYPL